MQNRLHRIFAPPRLPEDEDTAGSAAILNGVSWSALVLMIALLILRSVPARVEPVNHVDFIFVTIGLAAALTLFLMRQVSLRAGSFLFVAAGWLGLSALVLGSEGVRDVGFFGYAIPILMAGLFFGWRGIAIITLLSIFSGWAAAWAETGGLITPVVDPPYFFARDMTGVLAMIGILGYLTITRLQNALKKSRSSARELSVANAELNDLRTELERRVEQRTSELQRRAAQLEAFSSVARKVASMQDLDELLPAITKLISQQFNIYHIGVYLLDPQRKRAVLRASNSEAGLQMVHQHYSLPVDYQSIIGYSILTGEPRIALNAETDSLGGKTLELPETRSALALPLRVAGRVTGALDIQSTVRNAFSPEDINVLNTLADQVAIAIENARLFSDAKAALEESRTLFEKYTRQEWASFAKQVRQTGFVFDGKQVTPVESSVQRDPALSTTQPAYPSPEQESASISIPLKLRGQVIGVLDIRSKKGARIWKQDDLKMLEAAAERAALALETARLVESAQRRAARERAIGDISARIGAVSNLESILQTAVEELGRKIGGATEVTLEIGSDQQADAP